VRTTLLANGTIQLTDPVTGAWAVFDPTLDGGYGGSSTCSGKGPCPVISLGRAADGSFTADFSTSPRLLAMGGIEARPDKRSTLRRRERILAEQGRSLQAADPAEAKILSPVVCVNVGAVVLFDVDAVEGRYPVYLKDSILNTNQDFDRATLDELATRVARGDKVRSWAQAFEQPGIYVFADSKDLSKLTVIAVKAADEACLDSDAFI
jgi:hypothetical protein